MEIEPTILNESDLQKDFKGVWIPKKIWLDTRLTAENKIILMGIINLSNEGVCTENNISLSKFCGISETKISESIVKLVDLGYLFFKCFNGGQRELFMTDKCYMY